MADNNELDKLRKYMKLKKLSIGLSNQYTAALISCEANLYYLTGFANSEGTLFVTRSKSYLLVDFRYAEAARKNVTNCEVVVYERYEESLAELLKKHGINWEVNNDLEITTSNFYQYNKSGQVIISVHPCILENKDGNIVYQGKSDGGHAMTVTGVTDDGRFVVSSWGRTYYVKPDKKYKHIYFQQVIYK